MYDNSITQVASLFSIICAVVTTVKGLVDYVRAVTTN